MQLESFKIERMTYGVNAGKLQGDITYKNSQGRVQLLLNDSVAARLLYIVAEEMVESTKSLAEQLTADIITQVPQLENKE